MRSPPQLWVSETSDFFFFFFKFLAVLGLHCCAWSFSRCGERFTAVLGLLTVMDSLVAECGSRVCRTQ